MGYDELHRSFGPEEGASADEANVRRILGELNRVEAPKNFDFKVKAKIANTRPEDLRKPESRLVFLRYAMPLLLVLVVISGAVVVGLYRVDNSDVPEVAITAPVRPIDAERTQPATSPAPSGLLPLVNTDADGKIVTPPSPVEGQTIVSTTQPRGDMAKTARAGRDAMDDGRGSKDSTLGNPKPIIDLKNAPASAAPAETGPRMPTGQIPVQTILEFPGIKTTYSNNGWRVNSVVSNSIAEKAGIKEGDLIEGINGQPVTQGTKFSGQVRVRSLRVGRNGQSMDISF